MTYTLWEGLAIILTIALPLAPPSLGRVAEPQTQKDP